MRVGREMLRNLGCLRKPSTARCRLSSSRRARPSIRPPSLHSAIPLASPACGFPPASARALLSGNVALARRLAALFVESRLLQQVMGCFRAFEADAAVVFPGKREQGKRPAPDGVLVENRQPRMGCRGGSMHRCPHLLEHAGDLRGGASRERARNAQASCDSVRQRRPQKLDGLSGRARRNDRDRRRRRADVLGEHSHGVAGRDEFRALFFASRLRPSFAYVFNLFLCMRSNMGTLEST